MEQLYVLRKVRATCDDCVHWETTKSLEEYCEERPAITHLCRDSYACNLFSPMACVTQVEKLSDRMCECDECTKELERRTK